MWLGTSFFPLRLYYLYYKTLGKTKIGKILPKQTLTRPDCWQFVRCVHLHLTQSYCPLSGLSLQTIASTKSRVNEEQDLVQWLAKQSLKTGQCFTSVIQNPLIVLSQTKLDTLWDVFICLSHRDIVHSIVWHFGQKVSTKRESAKRQNYASDWLSKVSKLDCV